MYSSFCTTSTGQSGWRKTGIFPPNPKHILSLIPALNKLCLEDQQYVLEACYLIAFQIISGNNEDFDTIQGVADDHYMQQLLEPIFGPILMGTKNEIAGNKKTTDLCLNRWRACFVSSRGVRKKLLDRKLADEEETKQKIFDKNMRNEAQILKKAKEQAQQEFDKTEEGQRVLKEKQEKKEASIARTENNKLYKLANPGKKAPRNKTSQNNIITCTFCSLVYLTNDENRVNWDRYSILSCYECKVFACPNDNCQRLRLEHEQSKKDGH